MLAEAGIGSRRASEELIKQGRVTVNGETAILGTRVDPANDEIRVDDSRVRTDPRKSYVLLNKPKGVVTTSTDPEGRRTAVDLVQSHQRLFPVGRLDFATEGILLLTNDGDLAHRLTHPSFEIEKVYVAEVLGGVTLKELRRLEAGVRVDEGRPAKAVKTRVVGESQRESSRSVVELTLHEGRQHVVRKMLDAIGHPVEKLTRTRLGPIRLGRLKVGEYRDLTQEEIQKLFEAVGM